MQTENIFIAHPSNNEQITVLKTLLKALKIKFEITKKEEPYNTEFVNMVLNAENEIKNGKSVKISSDSFDNLWN